MCGIIGYVGEKFAKQEILQSLKLLEYRGYDSAGLCCFENGQLKLIKKQGKVSQLAKVCKNQCEQSHCGIGHTRWATHGTPSDKNAHPHLSENNGVAIVHNGIIENFETLKVAFQKQGVHFRSETDSEVIAQLLQESKCETELKKVQELTTLLSGSYAIVIMFDNLENQIFAIRKGSPLILGKSTDGVYLSSDVNALVSKVDAYYELEEDDIVWANKENAFVFNKNLVPKEITYKKLSLSAEEVSRGAFEHFMLKEIMQVPQAITSTINEFESLNNPLTRIPAEILKEAEHFSVVGCGTAFNAGNTISYYARQRNIFIDCYYASEYRYEKYLPRNNDVGIFISQSGETADTIEALKKAKANGVPTIVVTNVASSTINKIADYVVPTKAGPEIAVASTKAYSAQITALYAFIDYVFCIKNNMNYRHCILKNKIQDIADKLNDFDFSNIEHIAQQLKTTERVFFIGRGVDYATSQEASLKLKEISNIHSESLCAGELKHGTLALIDEKTFVIVVATQKGLFDKTINSIYEVKARGAKVVLVTQFDVHPDVVDALVKIPQTDQMLMSQIAIYPLQMLAYKTALYKGLDPDKPRNLAKSVTVE